jgi:hypothetical protein
MNHLERQLRSWMPRPPSGKLKTRLFTGEAVTESENPWQFSWRHFAPVTGILFLVMTLSAKWTRFISRDRGPAPCWQRWL